MSAPAARVRIWLEVSHHQAFRVGGWAYVRADGAELTGWAGGDRRVDADAVALAGLAAALKGVAKDAAVELRTASAGVAGIPGRIAEAQAGGAAPEGNVALWAQAMAALGAVSLTMVRAPAAERPVAFCASWAEVAREKGKLGPFGAAIPKPNLAKAGV